MSVTGTKAKVRENRKKKIKKTTLKSAAKSAISSGRRTRSISISMPVGIFKHLGVLLAGCILTAVVGFGCFKGYQFMLSWDGVAAKVIFVSGAERLTQQEVLETAGVKSGMNLFRVNLSKVRKQLMNHPWVARAEVKRDLPSRLHIKIKEHKAVAVIDMGDLFMMNQDGHIFKKTTKVIKDLPLIKGVPAEELIVSGGLNEKKVEPVCLTAVLEVLKLGETQKRAFSRSMIKEIIADQDLGITLSTSGLVRSIRLGFENYAEKLGRMEEVFELIKERVGVAVVDTIDLNDMDSVVFKPAI